MRTDNFYISIIIPLYNKEVSISRAIYSVLNQTYQNYEIIIVDDGSTDSSVDIVKPFLDNSYIRLIRKQNGGVSSARNRGIDEAKYNYIAFLDADDCWKNDFLETLVELIKNTKNAVLWGGRQEMIKDDKSFYSSKSNLPDGFNGYICNYWDIAIRGLLYHASSIIVRKDAIIDTNIKFNENLVKGEDLDFYFRIALKHKVAYIDKVISEYRLDSENRAMNKFCPMDKRLVGNLDLYDIEFVSNVKFRKFLSEYALTCVGLLLNENYTDKDISNISKYIDFKLLSFRKKIYYLFPNVLKKYIFRFLK